jgi:hypothetical protein
MILQTTTLEDFTAATELMAVFGSAATSEAASRASKSRDRGNLIRFCQWRQVGRLIEMLNADDVRGTIH